jgi:hypothetical protein
MGKATDPPIEQARSIFDDLGYEIAGNGTTFSASRDWKEVTVSAITRGPEAGSSSGYRCFVTWEEHRETVARELEADDLGTEWALIAVAEDGDYEVARAPSS